MDPVTTAALIGGGASLLGGLYTNDQAKKESERNRKFQEQMSSTAYQRATADMRAAGLNPMLAYQQGGASTPSGGQAQISDPIEKGVSTAMEIQRYKNETKAIESTANLQSAQAKQGDDRIKNETALTAAQIDAQRAQAHAALTSAKATAAQLPAIEAEASYRKKQADFNNDDKVFHYDNYQRRINESLGLVSDALQLIPKKSGPKGPSKLTEKLNKKTGEIELWQN